MKVYAPQKVEKYVRDILVGKEVVIPSNNRGTLRSISHSLRELREYLYWGYDGRRKKTYIRIVGVKITKPKRRKYTFGGSVFTFRVL